MSDKMIIQDREELIYLLCEAAEFEHTVMCSYLYAQWTLKCGQDEGVTPTELAAIERWRRSLAQVALEEMLHLSLVNNLLLALGAAPHLWRPAFPVRPGHFPADVLMSLTPFGEAALDHFMYIERPEGLDLADGAGFGHALHYRRIARPDMLAPSPQDYSSQGHLYHGILQGLVRLSEQIGEERVFVGHDQAQVSVEEFGLPGLFKICDLASAHRAVEEIVLQGEGAPAHRDDSHFARFKLIRSELGELRAARQEFEPARPVVSNPMLGDAGITRDRVRVVEPLAGQVIDLGNSIYMLMIRALSQVFAPAPLPRALRLELATSSNALMSALGRVADVATRLPIDAERAGSAAAPNFELPGSAGGLVQTCAARILGERSSELGAAARRLARVVPLTDVANNLELLARRFEEMHLRFEPHLGEAVDRVAQLSVPATPVRVAASAAELPNIQAAGALDVARTDAITLRFDGRRCIHSRHCVLEAPNVFLANSPGAWIHPEAESVEHCVHIAHSCPSGAITYERHDGGPQESAPSVNVVRVRENGPYAVHARLESTAAEFRVTLCRCGRSNRKPYCDGSHAAAGFSASGEPASIASDPLAERGGRLTILPLPDGPLQLSGNVEICSGTGRTVMRTQSARLCRCGASGSKPFCDGSHARIGFHSEAPS
jgi:CDGSH-type Zn-finger protein/uncharacterized Fe-S cluster protein YjdI